MNESAIVHPLTGELLDRDDLAGLVEMERRVDVYLRRQRRHYAFRGNLRERIAELRGPAVLPRASHQTDTQKKVDDCPRCGRKAKKTG